jgi:hypothetical protein
MAPSRYLPRLINDSLEFNEVLNTFWKHDCEIIRLRCPAKPPSVFQDGLNILLGKSFVP